MPEPTERELYDIDRIVEAAHLEMAREITKPLCVSSAAFMTISPHGEDIPVVPLGHFEDQIDYWQQQTDLAHRRRARAVRSALRYRDEARRMRAQARRYRDGWREARKTLATIAVTFGALLVAMFAAAIGRGL